MQIRAINAKYGGAAHDSLVWSLCPEKEYLEQHWQNGDKNSWILGNFTDFKVKETNEIFRNM